MDDKTMTCPYTGHKKLCSKLRDNCPKWTKLITKHPQTGVPIDEWACADTWTPILLLEIQQRINEQGAAVESMRNRMVEGNNALIQIGMQSLTPNIRMVPAPSGNQHDLIDITPDED